MAIGKFLVGLGFIAFLLGGGMVHADSMTQRLHNECMTRHKMPVIAKHGAKKQHTYAAWFAGHAYICLALPHLSVAQGRAETLRQCERAARKIKRRFGVQGSCVLVVDQGRIIDQAYRSDFSGTRTLPVSVKVFDGVKNVLQPFPRSSLTYRQAEFSGTFATRYTLTLSFAGKGRCTGYFAGTTRWAIEFVADCFGERFVGKAKLDKVVRAGHQNKLIDMVPKRIKLASGTSWIEITF